MALCCTLALNCGTFRTAFGQSSPIQQAVTSDAIVIGKVVEFEHDLITIDAPGRGKCAHSIASVQVEEPLLGLKGLTHVRVGLFMEQSQPNYRSRRARIRVNVRAVTPTQEGCFFLRRIAASDIFLLNEGDPLDKTDANYDTKLACVRSIAKTIAKPGDALRSHDEGERQLAACVVALRQGPGNRSGAGKALGMEESKLALLSLAQMKWSEYPFDPEGILSLSNVFTQLQLSEREGWRAPIPKENEDPDALLGEAVPKWLKVNAGKFRIKPIAEAPGRPY